MEELKQAEAMREAYARAWQKPDRRPIWEWAHENVILPSSAFAIEGPFNVEISPYLKFPFQLLQNDQVRQVNILKAVQTFGSGLMEVHLQWVFKNEPGPAMTTFQTDDDGDEHFRTRIEPVFESSPANSDIYGRMRPKRGLKKFPHMDLYVNGANLSSLQRKSIKYLYNDEVWCWDPGMYGEAVGRTEAFPFTCKILNISQAGIEGDEWDEVWNLGKRFELGIRCVECDHLQPLDFFATMLDNPDERAGIVWDPEAKRADGTWDRERAGNTAAFKCRKCGHEHPNNAVTWDQFRKSMEYIDLDPARPMRNVSLRWTSLVRGVWDKYVDEYLTAMEAMARGSIEPLKKFYQKKLVKPWQEDMGVEKIDLKTADYQKGGEVPEDAIAFITADYQEGKQNVGEHYWVVCRAWREDGSSRLIDECRVDTPADIYQLQLKYQVDAPRVVLDGGDNLLKLAAICAKYGWTLMEGSHREAFPHKDPNKKKPVLKPYAPRRAVDPGRGTRFAGRRRVYSFMWSNPTVKDIAFRLRHGKGVVWELPMDISKDYEDQIDSEAKVMIRHPKTGAVGYIWKAIKADNHLWDCECMQVVCGLILGVIKADLGEDEDPVEDDRDPPQSDRRRRPKRSVRAPHESGQQMELISA